MIVVFFFHFSVEAAFSIFCVTVLHAIIDPIRSSVCLNMISVSSDLCVSIFILFYSLTHTSSCHHSYYLPGPLGTGKINCLTKIRQQLLKPLFYFWPLHFEMLHSGHPQCTCTPPIHTLALLSPDQLPDDPASLSVSFSDLTKRIRYDDIQSNDTTKF